ncbi:efflux transporter, RND family, MFP subunit [Stanieria cyanosphaera PCC 7437]|uniref:Efflux transporter, RND family, MFP subunit n=1 Tax=Stanieria cyanosphaera (strain ATCC 29371 / PCC 7437) TaxID=111780 RepID=K9XML6_STAC7|nr:efflux RND transporter periplasmic adaptor subunit [Stanieria cyanosphaera]AFZ33845.1 efflux transporter, RND family, MFP subunit [Stanieria cyanosphaera PCC 7437]
MNKQLIDIEATQLNNETVNPFVEETIPTQQITQLKVSSEKSPSEQLIEALLTYPDRAIDILEANEELINSELVEQMELAAVQMKAKGSTDAANFLKNIASQIKKALAVCEFREANEESLSAYHHLIEVLLTYPNQTSKILATNKKLLDAGLFQVMEQMAMQMSTNGSEKAAVFLQDLADQLQEAGYHQLPAAQTKRNWKLWFGGAVVLLSGLSILLINPFAAKTPPSQESTLNSVVSSDNALPFKTVALEAVDSYQVSRNYTGTIAANRSSELGFERNGKLLSIDVDEGQKVETGTILATLDRSSLEVQRQQLLAERSQGEAQLREMQAGSRPETIAAARAKLDQAQAQLDQMEAGSRAETIAASRATVTELEKQLELAQSKRDRRKGLYQQGAISREQYEEVDTEVNAQQARLDQAKSQLDEILAGTRPEEIEAQQAKVAETQSQLDELLAGTRPEQIDAQQAAIAQIDAQIASLDIDLNKSTLKAPFAGTIGAINLNEGTAVSAGQGVIRLVENGDIEAHIGVPVAEVAQIKTGSTQSLKIGEKIYQAKVSSVLPEVDSATRTRTVVLKLEGIAANEISPGQTANLALDQTVATSGYWLPNTALVSGVRGLWSCYVIGEPIQNNIYRVARKDVEVLYTEGERVLVRGTLQKSDRVIVSGTNRLAPGQLVSVIGD